MYTLRPYQRKAVENTLNYFKKKQDPAVIVLPTGAGKSLVIAQLAKLAKGRVLVLAHVKELVEQNYLKYISYELEAGIYSAGLNQKEIHQKVIFGSIQSVARADDSFFNSFSLLIIDECHRVAENQDTQYAKVIKRLKDQNPKLCILGLTATPYRLGSGWIYQINHNGVIQTNQEKFFKYCIYELPLSYMIKNGYLTPPVKVDIPVTSYNFSELTELNRMYTIKEVEALLQKQKRLTPLIIKNIINITEQYMRKGVMIFSSTVNHAKEILSYLPKDQARLITGDTEVDKRDEIIEDFKQQKFLYLVNVSVLTTGFDAPHVDVIAILRPTESVSLYQQIIGRGLRLAEGKKDCFILDYTGMGHDIYTPEIGDKKPTKESEVVLIECPQCGFENHFWGKTNADGDVIEHYGRKCKGGNFNEEDLSVTPCGHLFRFKLCPNCSEQNDISAKICRKCDLQLVDADVKLKQARLSKNAHVLKPDRTEFNEKQDKSGKAYLEVKYYDLDANYLSEIHYLNKESELKRFHINFLRSHIRRPDLSEYFETIDDVIKYKKLLRNPSYVIARKRDKFWKITEKIFIEEL